MNKVLQTNDFLVILHQSIINTLHTADTTYVDDLPSILSNGRRYFIELLDNESLETQFFWATRWDREMKVSLQFKRFMELFPFSKIVFRSSFLPIYSGVRHTIISYLLADENSAINQTALFHRIMRIRMSFLSTAKM